MFGTYSDLRCFDPAGSIKMTSKGPIIFKQDRYGLNGRKIRVWKFRSMTVTESDTVVTQAKKGDMSVIGPRPHGVAHNEEYRKLVDFYMLRHKV
jgi:putative colanic acid biosynthesis UDP-glucose lipid carrier transferase